METPKSQIYLFSINKLIESINHNLRVSNSSSIPKVTVIKWLNQLLTIRDLFASENDTEYEDCEHVFNNCNQNNDSQLTPQSVLLSNQPSKSFNNPMSEKTNKAPSEDCDTNIEENKEKDQTSISQVLPQSSKSQKSSEEICEENNANTTENMAKLKKKHKIKHKKSSIRNKSTVTNTRKIDHETERQIYCYQKHVNNTLEKNNHRIKDN